MSLKRTPGNSLTPTLDAEMCLKYRVNFDPFHSSSLLSIFVRHIDFYFCNFSVTPPSFLTRTCLLYDFKHACIWYTVQCCAISVITRTISSPKFILLFTVSWNQANKILQMWIKEVGDGSLVKCSNPVSWRGGCFQSCDLITLCRSDYTWEERPQPEA